MKILALDFSTSKRCIAVVEGTTSGSCVVLAETVEPNGAGIRSLQSISETLTQAGVDRQDIDLIAVGIGPGSYTGIRASLSLAQGWQMGRGTPVIGIGSAQAMAAGAWDGFPDRSRESVGVVIDAQRREYYLGFYSKEGERVIEKQSMTIVSGEVIRSELAKTTWMVGPDLQKTFADMPPVYPDAKVLARLAFLDRDQATRQASDITPIYLRPVQFVKAKPALPFVD